MPIFPNKLQQGDEVRVIAPSISLQIISKANVELAIKVLESLGLKVSFGSHVEECDLMLSSSIASRLDDLHAAFADENVKGILTVIGGFNSNQLLPYIDYELIKHNPKIFCGFSDITALSNAIYHKTGMVTYSGPHFSTFAMQKGFEYTLEYFKKVIFAGTRVSIEASPLWADDAWFLDQENRTFHKNSGYWPMNPGHAKGTIIGGNLGTLRLLQGTEYMPSLKDSILFLEDDSITDGIDVVEFDRSLQSLIQQPHFDTVRALVIGRFENKFAMSLEKLKFVIETKAELKNIPIIANADFGHTNPIFTFPIGGMCEVNVTKESAQLELL